ncbi:MAG: GNAT family N-acetyltransferase [Polyangiaceae bacterium]|nr:GNAT family N-acetyltransferase [Polyangiaceae bacterium]
MSYTAVPLRLEEHRTALGRLWAENMEDPRVAGVVDARMRWFYEESPYGAPRTWLTIEEPGGKPVGCGSYYPRDTFVRGRRLKAAILADFAVDKDHRVAGAAVTVQRAVATNSTPLGVDLLYGYPNKAGIQVFQRVGHKVVGEVSYWAKPLRSAYKIREFVQSPAVAEIAGLAVDALFWVDDARLFAGRALAYATETVRTADHRFDELWERASPPRLIMGERSSAYLNWRYSTFKTADYSFFCLVERASRRLAGYVAYVIDGPKVTIADLFCDDLESTAVTLLLRFAVQMRVSGVSFISLAYIGDAAFERQLEALNFMRASGSRPLVVYAKGVPEDLKDEIMDPRRWFMIDGELDI